MLKSHHDFLISTAHWQREIISYLTLELEKLMTAESDALAAAIQAATAELDKLSTAVDTSIAALNSSKATVTQLQADSADAEANKAALASATTEIGTLKDNIAALEAKLAPPAA